MRTDSVNLSQTMVAARAQNYKLLRKGIFPSKEVQYQIKGAQKKHLQTIRPTDAHQEPYSGYR